jgi:hypothetical protein
VLGMPMHRGWGARAHGQLGIMTVLRLFELEQADTAAWELVDKRTVYRCPL